MKPAVLFIAVAAGAACFADAGPVHAATSAPTIVDEISMADYLALLAQIAPAAHEGAGAYLLAHQQRCGRSLSTLELRRAVSGGDGDPVLMAMIRASELRDAASLKQLGQRIDCRSGGAR